MIAPLAVLRFVSLACCHTRDTGAITARALISSLMRGFPSDTCTISCGLNPPRDSDTPHDVFNVVLNLLPCLTNSHHDDAFSLICRITET